MPALVRQEQNTQMKHTRHTSLIEAFQIFILKIASGAVFCNTCSDSGSKASGSGDSKCKIKAEIIYRQQMQRGSIKDIFFPVT